MLGPNRLPKLSAAWSDSDLGPKIVRRARFRISETGEWLTFEDLLNSHEFTSLTEGGHMCDSMEMLTFVGLSTPQIPQRRRICSACYGGCERPGWRAQRLNTLSTGVENGGPRTNIEEWCAHD